MKKYLCLWLAALLLVGCSAGSAPASTPTRPTVPDKTPMEMLGQTVEKTLASSSFALEYALGDEKENFTLQFSLEVAKDTRGGYVALLHKPCGCAEYVSGKTAVSIDCESGETVSDTAGDYFGMSYLLRMLPALDKAVLERFCNMSLTATPGTDGGMRFSVSGLSEAEMEQLLGVEMEAGADFVGSFALEVDQGGNLTQAEYTQGSLIHRISLTKINQKIEISKPDWA